VFEKFNISSPAQQWKLILFFNQVELAMEMTTYTSSFSQVLLVFCPIIASQGPSSYKTIDIISL